MSAGIWEGGYEIARYENHFEKGMTDVTATYTLRSDGRIRVENEGFKDGIHKKAVGRAKQPEPENSPGKLKVAFFFMVLFRLLYLRTRRTLSVCCGRKQF